MGECTYVLISWWCNKVIQGWYVQVIQWSTYINLYRDIRYTAKSIFVFQKEQNVTFIQCGKYSSWKPTRPCANVYRFRSKNSLWFFVSGGELNGRETGRHYHNRLGSLQDALLQISQQNWTIKKIFHRAIWSIRCYLYSIFSYEYL